MTDIKIIGFLKRFLNLFKKKCAKCGTVTVYTKSQEVYTKGCGCDLCLETPIIIKWYTCPECKYVEC